MPWGRADSRDYITPFTILGAADVPSDFHLPPDLPKAFSGIFLPQENGKFGLHRCPPRILIVANSALRILTRRRTESTRIPLTSLETLECGRILLLGWIALQWDHSEQSFPYNRRGAATVERFLNRLKMSWLHQTPASVGPQSFGIEPDLKFGYAKSAELLNDEKPVVQLFHPPARRMERHFGFRHEIRSAGDLLLLSDRRLLWITDWYRYTYEPYGTVSRSAPLSAVKDVRPRRVDSGPAVEVALRSGILWRVPAGEVLENSANAFVDAAVTAIACASTTRSHDTRTAGVETRTT